MQHPRGARQAFPIEPGGPPSLVAARARVVWLVLLSLLSAVATFGVASAQAGAASAGANISTGPDVVVGEADGSVTIPVTLDAAATSTVTVHYATADGTAGTLNGPCYGTNSANVYGGESGTVTFLPGATVEPVTVPIYNCHSSDTRGAWNFYLNLTSPSTGSAVIRSSTQIDVVGDTAAASTPGLYVMDRQVDATAGVIQVPVTLGGPSGAAEGVPVTVNFQTHDGSAKAGTDYTAASGTLTFAAGETTLPVPVTILDSTGPARSFTVTLSSPTNASIAVATSTVTIGGNSGSATSLANISAPADTVVGESDGYVELPVTLTQPAIGTVTVHYATADGTAGTLNGPCYNGANVYGGESGTMTFLPGVTTQVVRVPIYNCHSSDTRGAWNFYLNLTSPSTGSAVIRSSTQIDVVGDTAAASTPGLYVMDRQVDATAGVIQVPVTLGGPSGAAEGVPVTVNFQTHDGSAKAGTDYTAASGTLTFAAGETTLPVPVTILDSTGPARSFTVTLSSPTNASIAVATSTVTIGGNSGSATSLANISAPADTVVGESDGYVELPVTLTQPAIGTVTVHYATADGTAGTLNGPCYNGANVYGGESGTMTFLPGVTTQVVRVPIYNCHSSDTRGAWNFYLNLTSPSTGSAVIRSSTQIDVVGDTAAASTPGLYVMDRQVDATAGVIQVPVTLGGPSGAAEGVPVTVNFQTHDGSAKAGTDYTAASGTLTFAAGETTLPVPVTILDSTGPARSFTVTLSSPTNASIAVATSTVTIGGNSGSATSLANISAPADTVVGESDGYVELPVTLTQPAIGTVTVHYATADGTAGTLNGPCYNGANVYGGESGTMTFLPGVTTQVVRVPIYNCGSPGALTFTLNLSSNSVGSTITRPTTTITVNGVPAAPTGVTAVAGGGAATVSFTPPASPSGYPVTSYTVTSVPGGITATGSSSPITVTGLTPGTSYTFKVTATNSEGTGPASAASNAVIPTVPGFRIATTTLPAGVHGQAYGPVTLAVAGTDPRLIGLHHDDQVDQGRDPAQGVEGLDGRRAVGHRQCQAGSRVLPGAGQGDREGRHGDRHEEGDDDEDGDGHAHRGHLVAPIRQAGRGGNVRSTGIPVERTPAPWGLPIRPVPPGIDRVRVVACPRSADHGRRGGYLPCDTRSSDRSRCAATTVVRSAWAGDASGSSWRRCCSTPTGWSRRTG